ncbi:MAG: hypothetical protein RLZZ398_2140 [Verrucomicrobiota bacterium]|jgi:hypothetical protein
MKSAEKDAAVIDAITSAQQEELKKEIVNWRTGCGKSACPRKTASMIVISAPQQRPVF